MAFRSSTIASTRAGSTLTSEWPVTIATSSAHRSTNPGPAMKYGSGKSEISSTPRTTPTTVIGMVGP